MATPELDRIDRKILDVLQRNGRVPLTELAHEVGLSASPVSERVRRLERIALGPSLGAVLRRCRVSRVRTGRSRARTEYRPAAQCAGTALA